MTCHTYIHNFMHLHSQTQKVVWFGIPKENYRRWCVFVGTCVSVGGCQAEFSKCYCILQAQNCMRKLGANLPVSLAEARAHIKLAPILVNC